jgi:hypothetical protein
MVSSPVLRRGELPRDSNLKDTTVSDKEDALDAGNRYRESGLVHGHRVRIHFSNLSGGFQVAVV